MREETKLKQAAMAIIPIPSHFRLRTAEAQPQAEIRHRTYVWEDPRPGEDAWIKLVLDAGSGRLEQLDADLPQAQIGPADVGTKAYAQVAAAAFVARQMPTEARELTWVLAETGPGGTVVVHFREESGGLSLPFTGCECTVSRGGWVVGFQRFNRRTRPIFPAKLADAAAVRREMVDALRVRLTLAWIDPSLHETAVSQAGYRLVYEAMPRKRFYDAVTGQSLFACDYREADPAYVPVRPLRPEPASTGRETLEELLDLASDVYELTQRTAEEGLLHYAWAACPLAPVPLEAGTRGAASPQRPAARGLHPTGAAASVDRTGRLISFVRDDCRNEGLDFNRQECWLRARQFLHRVFPAYARYLRLWQPQNGEGYGSPAYEYFQLNAVVGGILVQGETVLIGVHTGSGQIAHYRGCAQRVLEELSERHWAAPDMTEYEAKEICARLLQVELGWSECADAGGEGYKLVYRPVMGDAGNEAVLPDFGDRPEVRYIDAVTGEVIRSRPADIG